MRRQSHRLLCLCRSGLDAVPVRRAGAAYACAGLRRYAHWSFTEKTAMRSHRVMERPELKFKALAIIVELSSNLWLPFEENVPSRSL